MNRKPISYGNVGFDSLVAQLTTALKAREAWTDAYRSSAGQAMIELFAAVAQMQMFYLTRRVNETFPGTARLRTSLVQLANMVGYQPYRVTSAVGRIRLVRQDTAEEINVPAGTQFFTRVGNVSYVTTENAVIYVGEQSVDVGAKQGNPDTQMFTSTGESWQMFSIGALDVEQTSVRVDVAVDVGSSTFETWTRMTGHKRYSDLGRVVGYVREIAAADPSLDELVDALTTSVPNLFSGIESFLDARESDKVWAESTSFDDHVWIEFGNGKNGAVPTAGKSVRARFLRSIGDAGNIFSVDDPEGEVRIFNSPSADYDVLCISPFQGGSSKESAESIRSNAPRLAAAGDRAVTKQDYKALLSVYPGVVSTNVWGEADVANPDYNMFNRVKIAIVQAGYNMPSESFIDSVAGMLRGKSPMSVMYEFVNARIVDIEVHVSLTVLDGFSVATVRENVDTSIRNEFELGRSVEVGQSKRNSDIVAVVESVEGVDYCHITYRVRQSMVSTGGGAYTFNDSVNSVGAMLPMKPGTVGVRVGDHDLMNGTGRLVDDGAGVMDGVGGAFSVVDSSVDYLRGIASLTLVGSTSSGVYLVYEQDASGNPGDLVVGLDQVVRLADVVFE